MSAAGAVLVVEDDELVRDVVSRYLSQAGYQVTVAGDGEHALRAAQARAFDLVVLDLMLPGLPGLEVCRRLRAAGTVPIVMLTALGEEEDRVLGLDIGADDYITKPFSPRELVARVSSVLRRARSPRPVTPLSPITDGGLLVDLAARRAVLGGHELALTGREFDLLAFLIQHRGRAFTRGELLEQVWGWTFGDHSTVTVHVRRLREKLEANPTAPKRIATVWGVGYRYDSQE
jgi:DNA-binding response OmpR family regulator